MHSLDIQSLTWVFIFPVNSQLQMQRCNSPTWLHNFTKSAGMDMIQQAFHDNRLLIFHIEIEKPDVTEMQYINSQAQVEQNIFQ